MEVSAAEATSAEMDSLQQNKYDNHEKMRHVTYLLTAEEKRKSGHEKELEDELRGEISDLKAQLTEEEDQKMKAEEELKDLQSRMTEMKHEKMV